MFAMGALPPIWIRVPDLRANQEMGAGDALMAGFAMAIKEGKPLISAAKWACAVSVAWVSTGFQKRMTRKKVEDLFSMMRRENIYASI